MDEGNADDGNAQAPDPTVDDSANEDDYSLVASADYYEAAPGKPLMPQGDELLYSELDPRLQGEEVTRRGIPNLGNDPRPWINTRTHYMTGEEREDYRLSVNDEGLLVDAEGEPYTSAQQARRGAYPGSIGGDLFVMDEGGVFAADGATLQRELNQNTDDYTVEMVHHSTLAAGQREKGDTSPLAVAASGELRVARREEQAWERDEYGRVVTDQDGNYVPETSTVYEVRGISDASGHFRPDEDQTLQFVETLQGAGVDLDNTKINLVQKPVYDLEGDLRGNAPAVDVYSGEFIAAEGDQLALANKRSVMDEISGRRRTGPFTEAESDMLDNLDEQRAALDLAAERRARRIGADDDGSNEEVLSSIDGLFAAGADNAAAPPPNAGQGVDPLFAAQDAGAQPVYVDPNSFENQQAPATQGAGAQPAYIDPSAFESQGAPAAQGAGQSATDAYVENSAPLDN